MCEHPHLSLQLLINAKTKPLVVEGLNVIGSRKWVVSAEDGAKPV